MDHQEFVRITRVLTRKERLIEFAAILIVAALAIVPLALCLLFGAPAWGIVFTCMIPAWLVFVAVELSVPWGAN